MNDQPQRTEGFDPSLDEQCIHELTKRWCSICNPTRGTDADVEARRIREDLVKRKGWIRAIFHGICDGCGDEFEKGDAICVNRKVKDNPKWKAQCCATDEDFKRPLR